MQLLECGTYDVDVQEGMLAYKVKKTCSRSELNSPVIVNLLAGIW